MSVGLFEDQRICIVGGTAGIGLAIARAAAIEDANVIIAGRDPDKSTKVASKLGLNVEGRTIDILDCSSIQRFFADLGAVDHLVVTAAQVRGGMFRDGSLEAARGSMEGKFWSQYLCAKHAQVTRSMLLFSGTLSRKPMMATSIIGAVNGAIEALARSLAVELAPVRVNVISPGLVQGTEAYSAMPQDGRIGMMETAAARLPVKLVGDGDSIAGIACALMASPYATGSCVDIDGGGLLV
jgi:NAD(P)-dependent dehydrogenase (short-subunit alcohol dehydrogenase family)